MSYRHPMKRAPRPSRRATRDRQLHRKWSNLQLSRYRAGTCQYPEGMPHVSDRNTEAEIRENFSVWVRRVLASERSERRRSKVKVAEIGGVGRNTIDRWVNKENFPTPEVLRRFCDALKLDYSEPARILGWDTPVKPVDPDALAEEIRRAREIVAHPGTSERRRRVLETRIESAEAARRAAASSRQTAEQMERTAQSLLREALEDPEDAKDR